MIEIFKLPEPVLHSQSQLEISFGKEGWIILQIHKKQILKFNTSKTF